jgi:hypothetical protein
MNAKGLKVEVHCSWGLFVCLSFGAGLAWGLRDEPVPHAGVPEIVTRSPLNPQDYGLRCLFEACQNLCRSLDVAGGRRHDFWHSMKKRHINHADSEHRKE